MARAGAAAARSLTSSHRDGAPNEKRVKGGDLFVRKVDKPVAHDVIHRLKVAAADRLAGPHEMREPLKRAGGAIMRPGDLPGAGSPGKMPILIWRVLF